MRQYNIVSGILLILSIIDSALAAPVPVQEKRQACIDVVHIPRDAIIVLGKRADDELEKLAGEILKTSGKPAEASDAHVSLSSSPAPPGPDHESTDVAQLPAPNPAPSTANPNPSIEPPGPSIEPVLSDSERTAPQPNPEKRPWTDMKPYQNWDWATLLNRPWPLKEESSQTSKYQHVQRPDPVPSTASNSDSAPSITNPNPSMEPPGPSKESESPALLDSERTAPQPNPKKRPWTDMKPYQNWDWATLLNRPWPLKEESSQTSKYQHVQRPDPVPSTAFDSDSDSNRSPESPVPVSVVYPPFTITGLPTEPKHDIMHPPFTITGLPTDPKHDVVDPPFTITRLPTEPKNDVANPPFTITGLPKQFEYEEVNRPPPNPDPEPHLDHQSLTTDSQPVDVGNAAQRELQPDGRSLDPGE